MSVSPSTRRHIVILGGGYAGLTVAQRLSKQGSNIAITLIDAQANFVERNRLHQLAAGQDIPQISYPSFLGPWGVCFIQGNVISLKPETSQVTVDTAGEMMTLDYDYLVYALGSSANMEAVLGVRDYADVLDSVQSARRLNTKIKQLKQGRVLVAGGGLTGIEIAAELAESRPDLEVTLATRTPWSESKNPDGMSEETVQYLAQAFAARHIKLHSEGHIAQIEQGSARLENGSSIPFDICIWTIGFKPLPLAAQVGIQVNARGQIIVDQHLRSLSHPNIITVGDAASVSTDQAGACRMGSATALAMGAFGAKTIIALLNHQSLPVFRFVYLFRNIGLGRDDGVVQFVDRRDVPRDLVWTGHTAAVWKEHVVKSTLSLIGLQGLLIPPRLPPLRTIPQIIQGMQQYI